MSQAVTHLPVHLAPPHEGVLPHAYTIWMKSQKCQNCGSLHEFSEVYTKTHLKSRLGAGKYVTNLRPLDKGPEYNLPVTLMKAELREVPFCHECFDKVSLSHLPNVPEPERDIPAAPSWAGTGPDVERVAKKPTTTTPRMSLDDIFKDI